MLPKSLKTCVRGTDNRPDLRGGYPSARSRAVFRDYPVVRCACNRQVGKEEGPVVASGRKAKGVTGPHLFERDRLLLLDVRSNLH